MEHKSNADPKSNAGCSRQASSLAYIRNDRLLRQLIRILWKWKRRPTNSEGRLFSIPSAEELQDAGIEFQRKEDNRAGSFLDVEFDKNDGVLKIPYLYFSANLQTIFQNLISYEQCYPNAGTYFTDYAWFMDNLINTAKDVQILCDARIIEHVLGSNDEVAQSFNELCRQIFSPGTTGLYHLRWAINDHCRQSWPRWRAKLMRDYFSSPWAILSAIAAVLLLLLTTTQTVFSIFPNV